jgi:hypothetical protein
MTTENIIIEIAHAISVLDKVKKVYSNVEERTSQYFKPGDMLSLQYKVNVPTASLIQAKKELQRVLSNPSFLEEYGNLK